MPDQLARALGDKGILLAVFLGETRGGVKAVARAGGVALELIDLTDIVRGRIEQRIVIRARCFRLVETEGLVALLGEGIDPRRIAIGGGAEDVEVRRETKTPCVIRRALQILQLRAIGTETEQSGGKRNGLSAHRAAESTVADSGIDPVVETEAHVRHTRMGIADAETFDDRFAHIRLVVAIGVF